MKRVWQYEKLGAGRKRWLNILMALVEGQDKEE